MIGILITCIGMFCKNQESTYIEYLKSVVVIDEKNDDVETQTSLDSNNELLTYDSIEWTALKEINPYADSWLTVAKTPISTYVMKATESAPDWWLTHDIRNRINSTGCPYLDWRCTYQSPVLYIYGHHLSIQEQGFAALTEVTSNNMLVGLGTARYMVDGSQLDYEPAFSLTVEDTYLYLRYLPNYETFSSWLEHISADAQYRNPSIDQKIGQYRQALVLITCTTSIPGQTSRTAIVFVR